MAGKFKRRQRHNNGGQLHAVVGGGTFAPRKLLVMLAHSQDSSPAAGARIARAGAVGEYFYSLHKLSFLLGIKRGIYVCYADDCSSAHSHPVMSIVFVKG